MSRRLQVALLAGLLVVTAVDVVSFYRGGWPGPVLRPLYLISPLVVVDAFLIVGLLAWLTYPAERIGALFTVIGYAFFLPLLIQIHTGLTFTVANVTGAVVQAALAHLALAWPYGRLRCRFDRVIVALIYLWNLANPIASNLFWNPRTHGCTAACPSNVALVDSSSRIYNSINSASAWIGAPLTLAVIIALVRHWRDADGYTRRAMSRMLWVAIPIAIYIELINFEDDLRWPYVVLHGYGPLILVSAPVAYVIGRIWTRRAHSAVGVVLVDLHTVPSPARLREALATALGDPRLTLAFRHASDGPYVDTLDKAVDPRRLPDGRAAVALDESGSALLICDEMLGREDALFRIAIAAAGLALEHARLQAEVEDQLEEVQASRARIVEAGDAERRRLERDLHDGAQQRLVTLTLALGIAAHRAREIDPELSLVIDTAREEAREALVELRELARGIHPAVLTQAGLRGGVQALVERSPVPTTVTAIPENRLPESVEATAYFVVSEALANVAKHAASSTADVAISLFGDRLTVSVCDDGPGGARAEMGSGLRGLNDRVASVGGTIRIESPLGGGTCLTAEIPVQ
jgi:signal transduction histidine kinase